MRLFLAFVLLSTACGECEAPAPAVDASAIDLAVTVPEEDFTPAVEDLATARDFAVASGGDLGVRDLAPRCLNLGFDGTYHELLRYSRPGLIGRINMESRVDVTLRGNVMTRPRAAANDQLVCESGTIDPYTCRMYCCPGATAPLIEYTWFAALYEGLVAPNGTCRSPDGTVWTVDEIRFE